METLKQYKRRASRQLNALRVIKCALPWPPSVNHYWRLWRGRVSLSREGHMYRRQVGQILAGVCSMPMTGPLAVFIGVYPPDRRRRDLDNLLKAIIDSLEHGGVFHDDSQIERLLIEKVNIVPKGKVVVHISLYRRKRLGGFKH